MIALAASTSKPSACHRPLPRQPLPCACWLQPSSLPPPCLSPTSHPTLSLSALISITLPLSLGTATVPYRDTTSDTSGIPYRDMTRLVYGCHRNTAVIGCIKQRIMYHCVHQAAHYVSPSPAIVGSQPRLACQVKLSPPAPHPPSCHPAHTPQPPPSPPAHMHTPQKHKTWLVFSSKFQ